LNLNFYGIDCKKIYFEKYDKKLIESFENYNKLAFFNQLFIMEINFKTHVLDIIMKNYNILDYVLP
jgi:hypothetical protein